MDWRARTTLVLLSATLLTLTTLVAAPDDAAAQEVAVTSRSTGMGEALTAGNAGTSAVWHNPAGIAAALMYAAEAAYAWDGQTGVNALQVNLVDTKSNQYVGAALSFTYENGASDTHGDREAYHVRGGLAVPLLDGMLRLGSALRYSAIDIDDEEVLEALIVDAGIMVQPLEWLSLGVSGLNLVNGGYHDELPRTIAAGVAFASLQLGFQVSGDVLFVLGPDSPDNARIWRAGAEYLIAEIMPLRAGFRYEEETAEKTVTGGVGYRDASTSIGMDASYQHNLDDAADKSFVGSLSVYF